MSKIRNLKIVCSWIGKNYAGYQIQPNVKTIESVLTNTWNTLTSDNAKIMGCSRLDAGVHARNYVFNVLSDTKISTERIVKSLNGILHQSGETDICIYSCEEVEAEFNARFSAEGKHYRYLIWNGASQHAFYKDIAWHVNAKNSLDKLQYVFEQFEGTHDFNSFRAADCGGKNTIKTIHKISVTQHPEFKELYIIDVFGDGFLKNMIRNIVGMGMLVINEKKHVSDIKERLKTGEKDYNLCAPAFGLTLMKVFYNEKSINS